MYKVAFIYLANNAIQVEEKFGSATKKLANIPWISMIVSTLRMIIFFISITKKFV